MSTVVPFSSNHQPSNNPRRKSPFLQLVDWQRVLNEQRDKQDTKPHVIALLARAFTECERLKREIRLKPKGAKPVDSTQRQSQSRRAPRFSGPLDVEPGKG